MFMLDIYGPQVMSSEDRLANAVMGDLTASGTASESELAMLSTGFDAPDIALGSVIRVYVETQQHAQGFLDQIRVLSPEKRLLITCDQLSRKASEHIPPRQTSGEPFYTHPQRIAAMIHHTFNRLRAEGYYVDPAFQDAMIIGGLLHDAPEDTLRAGKYYEPDSQGVVSPLLVKHLLELSGNPYADKIGSTLYSLSHMKQREWMPSYSQYVEMGSHDFGFTIIKYADSHDNLVIEPKIAPEEPETPEEIERAYKIHEKQALYHAAHLILKKQGVRKAYNRPDRTWAARYFEIMNDIRQKDTGPMVVDLMQHMYGNDQPNTKAEPELLAA